jgi:AcrR family transcriptional regulator
MASTSTKPATRRAQQTRSRETEERILRAVQELLAEKPLERLSIAEIAARARVSIGGFYARFASKEDALLHLSYESYVADMLRRAADTLDTRRWRGVGMAPIVEAYFRMMIEGGQDHLDVLRELVQRDRSHPEAFLAQDALDRFAEHVHAPFRRLLEERIGEVTHPEPERALTVGFSLAASALREALLFPHMRPPPGPLTHGRLATELTRMLCAYLGVSLAGTSAAGE